MITQLLSYNLIFFAIVAISVFRRTVVSYDKLLFSVSVISYSEFLDYQTDQDHVVWMHPATDFKLWYWVSLDYFVLR